MWATLKKSSTVYFLHLRSTLNTYVTYFVQIHLTEWHFWGGTPGLYWCFLLCVAHKKHLSQYRYLSPINCTQCFPLMVCSQVRFTKRDKTCQTPVWDVPTRKPAPKSSGPRKSLALLLRLKHFRASKLTFFALACLNTCYYKSYWWCAFCWCWCHYWRLALNAELTNLQKHHFHCKAPARRDHCSVSEWNDINTASSSCSALISTFCDALSNDKNTSFIVRSGSRLQLSLYSSVNEL